MVAEVPPCHAAAWFGYLGASMTPGVAAAVAVAAASETWRRTAEDDQGTASTNEAAKCKKRTGFKKWALRAGRCYLECALWLVQASARPNVLTKHTRYASLFLIARLAWLLDYDGAASFGTVKEHR